MKEFDNISISDNSCESNDNLDENNIFPINSKLPLEELDSKKIKYNSNEHNNQDKDLDTENIYNKSNEILKTNNLINTLNSNIHFAESNDNKKEDIKIKSSENNINKNLPFSNNIVLNKLFITINDNSIIYGGKKFLKVKYQGKIKKQTKIIFRCENYRKDSHIRQGNLNKFCQGKIIYEIQDDKYYFSQDHSIDCYDLTHTKSGKIKNDDNSKEINDEKLNYKNKLIQLINNKLGLTYASFKKESIEIYKNSRYQFPYNSTYIHNLFYKNKETSNMFSEQIVYKYKLTKNKIPFLKRILNYYETENPNTGKIKEYKAIIWASDINIAHAKKSNHFYIDSTFIRPIGFYQLLVVLYQDILTSKNYPLSYVIMNNKSENLYIEIFNYLNNIININTRGEY